MLGMMSACGGQAVLEATGEGGAGGEGGISVATLSACTVWCGGPWEEQCQHDEPCMDRCLETASYLEPCAPEYEVALLCYATAFIPNDPPACDTPPDATACETETDALLACVFPAGPCEIGQCVAGGPSPGPAIVCDRLCGGVVYTSACGQVGSGAGFPMDCECQIDGETVGTCQNVTGNGSAGLGCCSEYFAVSE